MRGVTVSTGDFVRIGVLHSSTNEPGQLKLFSPNASRCTIVRATVNGQEYKGKATCNPKDNFCKLEGRKRAASRLLKQLPLSKQDKRAIFLNVCPEFQNS